MKTYRHLWGNLISDENIREAIINSSKGKRDRTLVQSVLLNIEQWIPLFRTYAETFTTPKHVERQIYDGISRKKRTIIVPSYYEQIIHHMLVQILQPIVMHGMYEHSYGSIPSRGVHLAKKRIEKWLKDRGNTRYYLKMDIRQFYPSIDHSILKERISKTINDDRFLSLLFKIIDVTDTGLPLGFYTSQWLANWLLQDLDHFIKEKLHAVYYVRYMDDMVIFGSNKRSLHKMRIAIAEYLESMHLEMKDNWQIMKLGQSNENALDYMGFRFYREKTTLRKSLYMKASRKARRIAKKARKTIYDCRQMLSYLGWFRCTDTYNAYRLWIKPYINIRILRQRISLYDRRKNLCGHRVSQ